MYPYLSLIYEYSIFVVKFSFKKIFILKIYADGGQKKNL